MTPARFPEAVAGRQPGLRRGGSRQAV